MEEESHLLSAAVLVDDQCLARFATSEAVEALRHPAIVLLRIATRVHCRAAWEMIHDSCRWTANDRLMEGPDP